MPRFARSMMGLSAAVLLASSSAFSQDSSDLFDKAPPAIDEALRARVNQFYQAHVEGKFREAFALVAEDSQDAFFASQKQQYEKCDIIRINYSDEFTKAVVVESCQAQLPFQGRIFTTKVPFTSNWKVVDGKWYWYHVAQKVVPNPFSPSGTVAVPSGPEAKAGNPVVLPDPLQAARNILAQVKLDKTTVHLRPDQISKDEVRISNEMPGQVSLSIDRLELPGLKITPGKTVLQSREETSVVFEYQSPNGSKPPSGLTAQLHVEPTGQVFSIQITFSNPEKPDAGKQ